MSNLLVFGFLLAAAAALVFRVGRDTTRRQIAVRSYGMAALYVVLIAGVVIPPEWDRISTRLSDASWVLITASVVAGGGALVFVLSFMVQRAIQVLASKLED